MRYTQRNPNQIPRHRTHNYLQNSVTLDYVGLGGLSLREIASSGSHFKLMEVKASTSVAANIFPATFITRVCSSKGNSALTAGFAKQ